MKFRPDEELGTTLLTTTTRNFLVRLTLRLGEVEKLSVHLVEAEDARQAAELAIRRESHERHEDTAPDMYGWYEDMGGEAVYRVLSVKEVELPDIQVMKKYL